MQAISNIDELTKRLLPLTYFRRKAGEVLSRLPQVGSFILTKDGKPVAKLSMLSKEVKKETPEERQAKLKPLIGGFKLGIKLTPKQINKLLDQSYEEMLYR